MKVAITGASGFVGRSLVEVLTAAGHECRGLTRSGSPGSPIDWVRGSLSDGSSLRRLVAGMDAVIHAAFDRPGRSFVGPDAAALDLAERNLIGTIRLIEAAREADVRRFVVLSSGAVHDDILPDRPLDETHPLWPRSHYGATKAAIEAFVHSYGRGEGFPICALRPTAIYGLADPLPATRWYELVAAIVRGEDVACSKGGKHVHVADVARAANLLLTAGQVSGEMYHCTDLFVAERHVAEIARTAARTRSRLTGNDPPDRHPIDCRKLKALGLAMGGEPQLAATIRRLVAALGGG